MIEREKNMSNYPPGMTRSDWKHIDGEQHYKECPLHEDYVHDCSKEAREFLRPEFSPPCWILAVKVGIHGYRYIRIDFCPWCGEDLGRPDCRCKDITEALKAEAAERKAANA